MLTALRSARRAPDFCPAPGGEVGQIPAWCCYRIGRTIASMKRAAAILILAGLAACGKGSAKEIRSHPTTCVQASIVSAVPATQGATHGWQETLTDSYGDTWTAFVSGASPGGAPTVCNGRPGH